MGISQSVISLVISLCLPPAAPATPSDALVAAAHPAAVQATELEASPVALLGARTKLRKLHLVRPDLIPFPLSYDVYC